MMVPRGKVIQDLEQQDFACCGAQAALVVAGKSAYPRTERAGIRRKEGRVTKLCRLLLQDLAEARHGAGMREQDNLMTQIRKLVPVAVQQPRGKMA